MIAPYCESKHVYIMAVDLGTASGLLGMYRLNGTGCTHVDYMQFEYCVGLERLFYSEVS